MKIELDKAVDAFLAFMSDQVALIPKLGERFLGYGALGALKANPGLIVNKVKPWAEMAGIVEDDMVNMDVLKVALTTAFENVPKVSYFGFTFTEEDAAALLKKLQIQEA
jgi:hypothetical protein